MASKLRNENLDVLSKNAFEPLPSRKRSLIRTPLCERQNHLDLSETQFGSCIDDGQQRKRPKEIDLADMSDPATTNTLLLSLIKRLDRQEKKLAKIEQKIDQKTSDPSSTSCSSTSKRSKRKIVPPEVRVS